MKLKKKINHLGEMIYLLGGNRISGDHFNVLKGGDDQIVFELSETLKIIKFKISGTDKSITISDFNYANNIENRDEYDFFLCIGDPYLISMKEDSKKFKFVDFLDELENTNIFIEVFRERKDKESDVDDSIFEVLKSKIDDHSCKNILVNCHQGCNRSVSVVLITLLELNIIATKSNFDKVNESTKETNMFSHQINDAYFYQKIKKQNLIDSFISQDKEQDYFNKCIDDCVEKKKSFDRISNLDRKPIDVEPIDVEPIDVEQIKDKCNISCEKKKGWKPTESKTDDKFCQEKKEENEENEDDGWDF